MHRRLTDAAPLDAHQNRPIDMLLRSVTEGVVGTAIAQSSPSEQWVETDRDSWPLRWWWAFLSARHLPFCFAEM